MSLSVPTMAAIRFGYGLRPGEAPVQGNNDLLGQLKAVGQSPPRFPVGGIEARRKQIADLQQGLHDLRHVADGPTRRQRRDVLQKSVEHCFKQDLNARLLQAVLSPNGFHERLATFWTNHFATSASKSLQMRLVVPLYEAEAIRPHINGRFADLLRSATEHPAMLIYLDQVLSLGPDSASGLSKKKGLNENLGRELLELHTLGAGSGYTQADVRAAAMVLTGLTTDRLDVDMVFQPSISEPGSQKVLGVNYGSVRRSPRDFLSLLDDLAANPKTAQHICRKLVVHFISDQPPDDIIAAMTAVWKRTDGDLTSIYAVMLDHPAAWANPGAKARQPFDFVVAGLRALNDEGGDGDVGSFFEAYGNDDVTDTQAMTDDDPAAAKTRKATQTMTAIGQGALRRMGQPTWEPPSPAGFEESFSVWITASQLAERLRWARRASAQFGQGLDPREFLKATLADAARDDTIRVVSQAPSKISGLMLALASPEFNRR